MKLKTEQVTELIMSIISGDETTLEYINPDKFIQHNQQFSDGVEGIRIAIKGLANYPEPAEATIARIFADDEFVVAHTQYNFYGPKIGIDLYRFENGLIVEHWDNLQKIPVELNPNDRSMIDGHTTIEDIDKSEDNKALVKEFFESVMIEGKFDTIANYFDGDNYIQHNPNIADGLSGLGKGIDWMQQNNFVMKIMNLHKVVGQGNFVLTISEGLYGNTPGEPTAFYDLFRVENGKIAEHWDVIQRVLPEEQCSNMNGKFGFSEPIPPLENIEALK